MNLFHYNHTFILLPSPSRQTLPPRQVFCLFPLRQHNLQTSKTPNAPLSRHLNNNLHELFFSLILNCSQANQNNSTIREIYHSKNSKLFQAPSQRKSASPQQKKGGRGTMTAVMQISKYEINHRSLSRFLTFLENVFFRTGLKDCFFKIQ